MIFAADAVQIIAQQHLEMTAHAAAQKSDLFPLHAIQLFRDQRVGFFPSDGFALVTVAQQRLAHAIGIVVMLHPRLTQAAHLAAVDRGSRIAFQLQHPALAHPAIDTATCIALRASRVVIHADARNHIVGSLHIGNYRFLAILDRGIAAAA